MAGIAFVFSGQGDQFPGMGKDLFDHYEAAKNVFLNYDSIRPGTSQQCFFGSEEELKETKNTQPCLFALELACAEALRSLGIEADAAAGFSLGEVAACTYAGVLSYEDGFRAVIRRANLMQKAAALHNASMAAAIRISPSKVTSLCERTEGVFPVNFNGPQQTVVAGEADKLVSFSQAVHREGGILLPLKVGGAFHSPYMEPAAEGFAAYLASLPFCSPRIPVYSNVTGEAYQEDFRSLLSRQIASPVLWEKTVRGLIGSGIDTFIEVGPGKTLSNLIRRIDPAVSVYAAADMEKIKSEMRTILR